MADIDHITFSHLSEGKSFLGKPFPLVIEPNKITSNSSSLDNLTSWIDANSDQIDSLLLQHGAILFRNFDIDTAQDFDAVIQSTRLKGMDYLGGAAVRTQITERVFTANESPSSQNIPFHHGTC
jgi:alpha-ketoglutarate-dependent taurine dioxygenase